MRVSVGMASANRAHDKVRKHAASPGKVACSVAAALPYANFLLNPESLNPTNRDAKQPRVLRLVLLQLEGLVHSLVIL